MHTLLLIVCMVGGKAFTTENFPACTSQTLVFATKDLCEGTRINAIRALTTGRIEVTGGCFATPKI